MIVKENTCLLAYATTLTTDGPTGLVDLRNPVFFINRNRVIFLINPV